ncbi:MAG: hypothetical protein Q4F79_12385 [Eubacteriales bacterium]|nr:hypothetical protein [Eubacteriales bacterium]
MRRLIFMGKHILPAAKILFEGKDTYTEKQMALWPELEVTVQDDGRYAVWVNLLDDADLLQDSKRDTQNTIARIEPMADEILVD